MQLEIHSRWIKSKQTSFCGRMVYENGHGIEDNLAILEKYFPDGGKTIITTIDGQKHYGNMKFQNRKNCLTFTNWTSSDGERVEKDQVQIDLKQIASIEYIPREMNSKNISNGNCFIDKDITKQNRPIERSLEEKTLLKFSMEMEEMTELNEEELGPPLPEEISSSKDCAFSVYSNVPVPVVDEEKLRHTQAVARDIAEKRRKGSDDEGTADASDVHKKNDGGNYCGDDLEKDVSTFGSIATTHIPNDEDTSKFIREQTRRNELLNRMQKEKVNGQTEDKPVDSAVEIVDTKIEDIKLEVNCEKEMKIVETGNLEVSSSSDKEEVKENGIVDQSKSIEPSPTDYHQEQHDLPIVDQQSQDQQIYHHHHQHQQQQQQQQPEYMEQNFQNGMPQLIYSYDQLGINGDALGAYSQIGSNGGLYTGYLLQPTNNSNGLIQSNNLTHPSQNIPPIINQQLQQQQQQQQLGQAQPTMTMGQFTHNPYLRQKNEYPIYPNDYSQQYAHVTLQQPQTQVPPPNPSHVYTQLPPNMPSGYYQTGIPDVYGTYDDTSSQLMNQRFTYPIPPSN
ncbi:hypothetical protein SNEBB_009069 [Seison nebaliae]|nr:hypothetical protein SNEBB_009069 [Seison nebaliae]